MYVHDVYCITYIMLLLLLYIIAVFSIEDCCHKTLASEIHLSFSIVGFEVEELHCSLL